MNTTMLRFVLCFFSFALGVAQASDLITYQGKLTDAASQPLPDGQYRLGVRVWDVAEGGETPLWARKYDVPVNAGVFSLMIGAEGLPWGTVGQAGGPLTASLKLALSGTSRFVEITVMSDANQPEKPVAQWQKISPRQALGSVPYAMNGVPPGTVVPFAGIAVPDGWLLCDGGAYSLTDRRFSALYASIQTAYGSGSGTFRVPDLRGRSAIGAGQGGGLSNRIVGQLVGTESHVLTVDQLPPHSHGIDMEVTTPERAGFGLGISAGFEDRVLVRRWWDNPTGTTRPTGGLNGITQPHNNMQPSLVLNYIIKL